MALKRINKVRVLDRTPVPRGKCAFSSVENFSPSAASEKVVFAQPVVCVNVLSGGQPTSQPASSPSSSLRRWLADLARNA